MDGITIYELNRRIRYAAEVSEKLGALPQVLNDVAKISATLAGKGKEKRPEGDKATEAYSQALDKLNSAINEVSQASAVIHEYNRLLEALTQTTVLAWPPACIIEKSSASK